MNCFEFRRRKLADPGRLPAAAQAHAEGCAGCAAFAREVDEGERSLERALMVPVPEGLADRVIFATRRGRTAWRVWAAAASVLCALALGVALWAGGRGGNEHARLAIEHVAKEPQSLAVLQDADPDAFRSVVQKLGGAVKDLPGRIRYIRLCPFDGGLAWHMVFETPEGLATLFLVPGDKPRAMQAASVDGWDAAVHPMQRGYYAVVTVSADATSRFLKTLRERIDWNA